MTPLLWGLVWLAVVSTVAFFAVREVRSGRPPVGDVDRLQHEAVREASRNRDARGPGNTSQIGFGG